MCVMELNKFILFYNSFDVYLKKKINDKRKMFKTVVVHSNEFCYYK